MTDDQIRIILKVGSNKAEQLLNNSEYYLYRSIQDRLLELVRESDVQLPLNCLQFHYYINSLSKKSRLKCSK